MWTCFIDRKSFTRDNVHLQIAWTKHGKPDTHSSKLQSKRHTYYNYKRYTRMVHVSGAIYGSVEVHCG